MVALAPLLTGPAALGLLSVAVAALLGVLAWRSLEPETKPAEPPAVASVQSPGGAQTQQPAGAATVPPQPAAPAQDSGAKGEQVAAAPAESPKPAADSVAAPQPAAPQVPEFDLVRVEPTGEAVVAGRAAPGAAVQLSSAGAVLGKALADANGQFVIIPKDLAPGDHLLVLESAPAQGGEGVKSKQTVSVRLPPAGKGDIVVALTAPDQPTKILSDALKPTLPAESKPAETKPASPQQQAGAAPAPAAGAAATADAGIAGPAEVVIRTVEAEEGGAFYASGAATPGADVRIYLNGSYVAEVRPGSDGRWSLRIEKGMAPGHYAVRADLSGPGSPKVVARAEVPFVYESARQVAAASPVVPVGGQAETLPPVTTQNGASAAASNAGATGVETPKAEAAKPDVAQADAGKSDQAKPDAARPEGPKADVVVNQIQTATVVRGDSLWRISRQVYGHGLRYTQIYRANESQIRDPDLIYPGQVLVVPKEPGKTE